MLDAPRLLEATGPFFTFYEGDPEALEGALAPLASHPDHTLHRVDGSQAQSTSRLLKAIASAMAFPDYFGMNWDALDECLTDLEWLPSRRVVLVFSQAGSVLAQEPEDLEVLVEILVTTAEAWAEAHEPGLPMSFHILLQDHAEALEPWVQACMEQDIPFVRVQG